LSFALKKLVKINELYTTAGWQSGHAAACKAVYAGSIPASASICFKYMNIMVLGLNILLRKLD
jgi:hypothetical protein